MLGIREYLKESARHQYHRHIHAKNNSVNQPRWRGIKVIKNPQDMILYAQVIFENKPTVIIETGTFHGGSSLFFADMLSLFGGKQVITVDLFPIHEQPHFERPPDPHPLITYLLGSSIDDSIIPILQSKISPDDRVMVVLDACHTKEHVAEELRMYAPLVTPGQYLVVEDCYVDRTEPHSPYCAVEDFLKDSACFIRQNLEDQFVFAVTRGGWLWKVRN